MMSEPNPADLLERLLKTLRDLELDFSWLIAVTSLIAQEIAVKKKLLTLGVKLETSNLGELINTLAQEMMERGWKHHLSS